MTGKAPGSPVCPSAAALGLDPDNLCGRDGPAEKDTQVSCGAGGPILTCSIASEKI
jgi:hypothetical protein